MNERFITVSRQVVGALERIKNGSFGERNECGETLCPKEFWCNQVLLCMWITIFKGSLQWGKYRLNSKN
jgi:hypothetical protein